MAIKRIVSLLPAATEIVCALGEGDRLVGRSHECDFPESVKTLPVLTEAVVQSSGSSAQIDADVKTSLQAGTPLYLLNENKLRELKPDLIITQAQCEVCAISEADLEKALSNWKGDRPTVLSLSPTRIADIWDDIRKVAVTLDIEAHGKEVLRALKTRVVVIIEKTCVMKQPPAVACIEWLEPLMAAGNWIPELVELAGGRNLVGEAGKHSPWLNWESLTQHDPEIIVLMPCGFDLQRTRAEAAVLAQNPAWAKLRAVRNKRVFVVDGNQYFNRPGPRIVESLEILTEIIHPDRFNFGHRGKGWEKL